MSSRVPRPQRQLRAPTATVRPRSVLSADHHARLAHRLTPRDRWLIRMLHEHHVLTTDTVTTMAFPSARSARQRLLELYQWDVIDRFQPLTRRGSAAMHYVLGGAGAAVLAAEQGVTTKALGYRHDHVLAVAHRHTLAHTVAINDFFARLVRRTITHHDVRLVAWWSETRCARYVGDLARPDAYGRITLPPPDTAAPPTALDTAPATPTAPVTDPTLVTGTQRTRTPPSGTGRRARSRGSSSSTSAPNRFPASPGNSRATPSSPPPPPRRPRC